MHLNEILQRPETIFLSWFIGGGGCQKDTAMLGFPPIF